MKKKDFLLHLIGEVSSYILEKSPKRMVISLHQEEDGLHLCVIDNNKHSDDEIERMRRMMNSQKRPELSGYYGAMTGHDMLGHARLDLLGWQVKHSDITRVTGGIRMDMWLGGKRFESDSFNIPNLKK